MEERECHYYYSIFICENEFIIFIYFVFSSFTKCIEFLSLSNRFFVLIKPSQSKPTRTNNTIFVQMLEA